VTLLDLYPILLLLGVIGLGVLWEVRRVVTARVAARRLATAAMGFLAVVMVTSLAVRLEAPAQSIPSSRLLSWQLNRSASGPGLDPATAQAMTAFFIEVEPPGCAPIVVGSWLADPIVTYTPWSVTITMHMNDTAPPSLTSSSQCPPHQDLPSLGGYRMGNVYQVHLREPLGGRALLDGSSFPPQARPYR
jgi:hypothetical protein